MTIDYGVFALNRFSFRKGSFLSCSTHIHRVYLVIVLIYKSFLYVVIKILQRYSICSTICDAFTIFKLGSRKGSRIRILVHNCIYYPWPRDFFVTRSCGVSKSQPEHGLSLSIIYGLRRAFAEDCQINL